MTRDDLGVELPQHDGVREQPPDVEHAEERAGDAHQRFADLASAELREHDDEQRRGHQQGRVVLVAQVRDHRKCDSPGETEAHDRVRALVLDQAVELPLRQQHEHHHGAEHPQAAPGNRVQDDGNQDRGGKETCREIAARSLRRAGSGRGWRARTNRVATQRRRLAHDSSSATPLPV